MHACIHTSHTHILYICVYIYACVDAYIHTFTDRQPAKQAGRQAEKTDRNTYVQMRLCVCMYIPAYIRTYACMQVNMLKELDIHRSM